MILCAETHEKFIKSAEFQDFHIESIHISRKKADQTNAYQKHQWGENAFAKWHDSCQVCALSHCLFLCSASHSLPSSLPMCMCVWILNRCVQGALAQGGLRYGTETVRNARARAKEEKKWRMLVSSPLNNAISPSQKHWCASLACVIFPISLSTASHFHIATRFSSEEWVWVYKWKEENQGSGNEK